jgi:hypothetical protein
VAASVPLAVLGLVLFSTLGFTVAFSRRGEAQAEAVQEARAALQFLAMELRESSAAPNTVAIFAKDDGASRDGVSFPSARVDAPGRAFVASAGGAPDWRGSVYYFHDRDSGELRRFTAEPDILAGPLWGNGRLMATHIRQFSVEREGDLITLSLTVRTLSGQAVLQTAVRPRN